MTRIVWTPEAGWHDGPPAVVNVDAGGRLGAAELPDTTSGSAPAPLEHELAPTRTVWQLARLADVYDPDGLTSPGAVWLQQIEREAKEIAEYGDGEDYAYRADELVPVYTADVWATFVDLGAYREDVAELGADASDLTACARVALFMVAERLLGVLLTGEDE